MKRALVVAAAALALFVLGRAIVHSVASDETKIRWLVEDMEEGFDATRTDPVLRGLAADFRDESSGAEKQDVRQALAYLFFTAKDEKTKAFAYDAVIEIRRIDVQADAKPPTATCELTVRFHDLRTTSTDPAWEIDVTAGLTGGEPGWKLHRTTYTTLSGRMLR